MSVTSAASSSRTWTRTTPDSGGARCGSSSGGAPDPGRPSGRKPGSTSGSGAAGSTGGGTTTATGVPSGCPGDQVRPHLLVQRSSVQQPSVIDFRFAVFKCFASCHHEHGSLGLAQPTDLLWKMKNKNPPFWNDQIFKSFQYKWYQVWTYGTVFRSCLDINGWLSQNIICAHKTHLIGESCH